MNIFKKTIQQAKEFESIYESYKETQPAPEPEKEWVWVEGYKGTNKDMKCRDYQYELGVQHDMPNDEVIEECKNGFHLCLNLNDVCRYYSIGDGNRYFKVKALVRKSDKDQYGKSEMVTIDGWNQYTGRTYNKLVAKSIIFISELTIDEILKNTYAETLPDKYKHMAINVDINSAQVNYQTDTLVEDGYSVPFASHIIKKNKFDIAHAVGTQNDLSMDMKVLTILYEN